MHMPHWEFWVLYHIGYYSGPWVNIFGGFISDLGLLGVAGFAVAWYRKHNCHVRRCWRLQWRVTAADHAVCRKHHPENAPTAQEVIDAHNAVKESNG